MAKAACQQMTDAEVRRCGEQTGLDTLVVRTVNYVHWVSGQPAGEKYIRIELVYISGAARNVLAFSPVMEIPQGSEALNNIQPGKQNDYPEIIKLSGIEKILMNQYKNHRHSFSG